MLISPKKLRSLHVFSTCFLSLSLFSSLVLADMPTTSLKMPKASKSLLLDLDVVGQKIVAVGERGHIILSEDQGHSWVQADVPTAQMLNAVDFSSDKQGWAVGHDGNIVHTNDGGETWQLQRDGLKAQNEANIANVSLIKAKIKELEDKIAAGEQVQEQPAAAGEAEAPMSLEEQLDDAKFELETAQDKLKGVTIAPPLMDVMFIDDTTGWAVGAFSTLLQTTDGGKTWVDKSKSINNPDGNHLNAITRAGSSIFIGGEAGFLVVSQDNGLTWNKVSLGYEGTIFGLFAAPDGSFVVATGLRGNTFKSADGGLSWQTLSPGVNYSLAAGAVADNSYIVLVGTGGSIAISEDAGTTFAHLTLPARASLSSVVILGKGEFLMVGQGGVHHFSTASTKQ